MFSNITLLSLLVFLTACQSVNRAKKVKPPLPSYEISRHEAPSHQVSKKLKQPYTSAYGEIKMDDHEKVDKWIHYFQTDGRERMEQYLSRSTRFIPMMKQVFREYQLPEDLVYVAMIESGFNHRAHSYANAVGYWQFIAGTGRRYGLKINSYLDERRDPVLSTKAAAEYFRNLYGTFESWHLALASYNGGEYRINRFIMRYYSRDFWLLSSKPSFPSETANYVPKFIAAVRISKNPAKYGFENLEYQLPLEYDTVKLSFPISLKKLAQHIGVEYKEIKLLNPRYRGSYVPLNTKEDTLIRVPLGQEQQATAVIAKCRMKKPKYLYSDYFWYRVRRGDTLYRLARRNRTSISTIRRLNRMTTRSILRAGRKIKLPYYNRKIKKRQKLANTHIVKRGESLNSIARKYRTSITKLKKFNKLTSSLIHPGQLLSLIPKPKIPSISKTIRSSKKNLVHIVKTGETLIKIARKYKVSLPELMNKNNINFKNSHTLATGRQLVIP